MTTPIKLESKEPDKAEIQKILKQIKKGCSRKICYNLLCVNNIICKNSNLFL